jgi:predicted nucleotidyltransferase
MYPTARVKRIVSQIASEAETRFGPKSRLIWFGSWSKGTARLTSDIDLAIRVEGGVPNSELARFRDWIEEDLPTLYRIDLVNLDEVGEPMRRQIQDEGIIV